MNFINKNYKKKRKRETNSWFDMEYYKDLKHDKNKITFDKTDNKILRCKKIEIYPNEEQKKILMEWFDLYISVYNFAIDCIKEEKVKLTSKLSLRNNVKKLFNDELKNKINDYKIPIHTVDNAIFDLHKAYKSCFSKKETFRIRYKKHNGNRKCLLLESSCFSNKKNTICPRVLGNYLKSQNIIQGISKDTRLIYQHTKFILFTPIERDIFKINSNKQVGIDPGYKTFMTCYSPNNEFIKIGNGSGKEIKRLCKLTEKTNDKFNNNQKKRTKYNERIYSKIKNKVDDLHFKTIKYLCTKYSTIKLGKISTSSIVKKDGTLDKCFRKAFSMLKHYTFRERLKSKAEEYGNTIKEINEFCTSKMCFNCKNIDQNLGNKRIYNCQNCKWIIDRDLNGAINIFNKK